MYVSVCVREKEAQTTACVCVCVRAVSTAKNICVWIHLHAIIYTEHLSISASKHKEPICLSNTTLKCQNYFSISTLNRIHMSIYSGSDIKSVCESQILNAIGIN